MSRKTRMAVGLTVTAQGGCKTKAQAATTWVQ